MTVSTTQRASCPSLSKLGHPDGLQSAEHSPNKTAFVDGKVRSGFSRRRTAMQMIHKWLLLAVLKFERHRPVLWYRFPASMTPLDNHHATPFARLSHRSLPERFVPCLPHIQNPPMNMNGSGSAGSCHRPRGSRRSRLPSCRWSVNHTPGIYAPTL